MDSFWLTVWKHSASWQQAENTMASHMIPTVSNTNTSSVSLSQVDYEPSPGDGAICIRIDLLTPVKLIQITHERYAHKLLSLMILNPVKLTILTIKIHCHLSLSWKQDKSERGGSQGRRGRTEVQYSLLAHKTIDGKSHYLPTILHIKDQSS